MTPRTTNLSTSTAGSGPPPWSRCCPPTGRLVSMLTESGSSESTSGPKPAPRDSLNLTGSHLLEAWERNPAWPSLTEPGTTPPATTDGPSCARISLLTTSNLSETTTQGSSFPSHLTQYKLHERLNQAKNEFYLRYLRSQTILIQRIIVIYLFIYSTI